VAAAPGTLLPRMPAVDMVSTPQVASAIRGVALITTHTLAVDPAHAAADTS
jgi:hypothetical protein